MSYQVLARKWRPKSFGTLVGQEHVVRALSHALATGRLHHAWLFTGTRGVGKTTISRILAKALNCETGVTAEPCGVCSACAAIDSDRFPDYVEMDAASNRGVDDMAALLDQAVYAPVQGRYKVYMIDEVHMLTGHAFNAMLKTLEEPPEHVKFILATTDPQKIPVTVLSRCLQFNLKQMPPGHIVDHLSRILAAESIAFEAPALRHIARAASGSMRDALSLLDQAIAHGAGRVEELQVTHMLGTVGDDHLFAVLDGVRDGDVAALLGVADDMEVRSLSFDAALQTLASLFHRIALLQFAPGAVVDESERMRLAPYAEAFDAEFLQLAYQIAIHGRDELSLAPDDYAGFTMCLLRLVAFRPDQAAALGGQGSAGRGGDGRARGLPALAAPVPTRSLPSGGEPPPVAGAEDAKRLSATKGAMAGEVAHRPMGGMVPEHGARPAVKGASPVARAEPAIVREVARSAGEGDGYPAASADSVPPWMDLPPEAQEGLPVAAARFGPGVGVAHVEETAATVAVAEPVRGGTDSVLAPDDGRGGGDVAAIVDFAALVAVGDWHAVVRELGLGGMLRELAQHCEWVALVEGRITLRLAPTHRHLLSMNPDLAERLGEQVGKRIAAVRRVVIEVGEIAGETPAQRDAADRRARHVGAVAALESDPFVRELIERFDATLVEASVKPL
ncbi:MAG TPA: DNA polymerase III subunit gamma/tau [Rhodocyclaceae bacterium]|nr:DNA polymerase III subunit gamma/tau [Rhodocyclaceae bacterium]